MIQTEKLPGKSGRTWKQYMCSILGLKTFHGYLRIEMTHYCWDQSSEITSNQFIMKDGSYNFELLKC